MSEGLAEDIGFVTAVNGNRIRVEISKGGGCKGCGMHAFCGVNSNPIILNFETDGSYHIGDRVRVSVSSGIRVLSALLVFVLPLLALFAGYYIAIRFTTEKYAALAGLGGLVLAFLIVRLVDKIIGKKINFVLEGKIDHLP